jgi:hypothetical protein
MERGHVWMGWRNRSGFSRLLPPRVWHHNSPGGPRRVAGRSLGLVAAALRALTLGLAVCGRPAAALPAQELGQVGAEAPSTAADDFQSLKKHLYFHAPFEGGTDAKVARRDTQLYTAPTLQRATAAAGQLRGDVEILAGGGRKGDALRFRGKSKQVLFYPGVNMDYQAENWQGTVSVWLRLTPDQDLKEGYSDPLQITEKAWNDASFFIDFDIDQPRTFRLGVFADYRYWNPDDTKWDAIPLAERPMISVARPAMTRDRWTHVAWTFSGINADDGRPAVCRLYLDGELQGTLERPLRFDWNLERTAIMLGLDYIGDLDELMLFDRAFSAAEIRQLGIFFNED